MDGDFNLIELLTEKRSEATIIWLCNIGAEKYWHACNQGIVDKKEDILSGKMEEMNLLLCREQDILILMEPPDPEFLKALREFGFSIPRVLVPQSNAGNNLALSISDLVLQDESLQDELKKISDLTNDTYFIPYAVTEMEEKIAEKCCLKLIGPPSSVSREVNSKLFSREIAVTLGLPVSEGIICHSVDEIRDAYFQLTQRGTIFDKVIVKEPYGASGKGLYLIRNKNLLNSTLAVISRFAARAGNNTWLVEGWYDSKTDINYQIYISPSGKVSLFSIKEQVLNGVIYKGSIINSRCISEKIYEDYSKAAVSIGNYLFQWGYTGVASIDSIMVGGEKIIPIIEINGRFSLSTYISFLFGAGEEDMAMSFYYRVKSKDIIEFSAVYNMLKIEGILFDPKKKEGVFVYSSATLPRKCDVKQSEVFSGRIFVLIKAKSPERVEQYKQIFENRVGRIFLSMN